MRSKSPLAGLIASILAYVAVWVLIPRLTVLPIISGLSLSIAPLLGGVSAFVLRVVVVTIMAAPTVLFMAVQISIIYFFCRFRMNGWRALGTLIGSAALLVGSVTLAIHVTHLPAKLGHYPGLKEHVVVMGYYYGPARVLMSLAILFGAASIGCLVSLRIRDRNLLLPAVMVAAFIDLWTVTKGPVASIVSHAPEIAQAVSTPIPKAGAGAFVPHSMMGMGDPLFIALVFASVARLGMNSVRNFWFVLIAMILGMLAVVFGAVPYLPALIVLAVAVVAANWGEFSLSRQEKVSMIVLGVVLAATVPLVWSVLRPGAEQKLRDKRLAEHTTQTTAPK